MSVRIYPEWFIDGPWHGEDKRKKCPHLQGRIRCALPRPFDVRRLLSSEPTAQDVMDDLEYDEYTYVPKWVDVFGERICVWVSEENAGTLAAPSRYPDWVVMLGQIIMSPHRTDGDNTPFNVGGVVQRHRERWDIEHEVRRDVRRQTEDLQRQIRELESQLMRVRTANVLAQTRVTNTSQLKNAERSSALLEFKDDDGVHEQIMFENVVLYLDEGDGTPENPASWVATAQGPGDCGSDHKPPCMGYGTTKKAAIIALLADGLGVYARMIEIGERMK